MMVSGYQTIKVFLINAKNSSIYNPIGEYKDYLEIYFREIDSVFRLNDNIDNYDFDLKPPEEIAVRVLEMDCNNLNLLPDNALTIQFLNTSDTISFVRTNKVIAENIDFEILKIYGQEHLFNYYIKIDSERNFQMIKKNNRRAENDGTSFTMERLKNIFSHYSLTKLKNQTWKI